VLLELGVPPYRIRLYYLTPMRKQIAISYEGLL
jgi:hypothetical protein